MENYAVRKAILKKYENVSEEMIEKFLETEYDYKLSIEENAKWFGTFLQGIFD